MNRNESVKRLLVNLACWVRLVQLHLLHLGGEAGLHGGLVCPTRPPEQGNWNQGRKVSPDNKIIIFISAVEGSGKTCP